MRSEREANTALAQYCAARDEMRAELARYRAMRKGATRRETWHYANGHAIRLMRALEARGPAI